MRNGNTFVILRLMWLLKGYRTLTSKSITSIILGTEGSSDYELEKNGYWEAEALMIKAIMRVCAIDLKEFGMIT